MTFSQSRGVFNWSEFSARAENMRDFPIVVDTSKTMFFNVPVAFDIETSSFYSDTLEKRACMYEWTFGINGVVFVGRTWKEFADFLENVVAWFGVTPKKRLVVYVHNLAYEFQFIAHRFAWDKVFSLRERKPVYAITKTGIEFRCSYILSGYSLENLGMKLTKYHVEKVTGGLNYDKIRHSETPLTEKEWLYCENDVRVVMSYIQERIEIDGDITRIPLTKTGYVRRYCRKACLYGEGSRKTSESKNKYYRFRDKIRHLTIEPNEYEQLKRGFQGGFTHANAWKSGKLIHNVGSFDFTSSYPAVMVAEKFPMSKGERYEIKSSDDFRKQLSTYCCLFDVEFYGLESTSVNEHYISLSRCMKCESEITDNGRIVSASKVLLTITEQDFFVIERFYAWDSMKIGNFVRYRKAYLPTDFVKAVLTLYKEKTELKDVEGREIEYASAKEMVNSCYGMTVTDICRDEIVFNGEWAVEKSNKEDTLTKYNRSKNRFLFYPWGVWVTAYARKNLFTGIYSFGDDYIYSDTDSIKATNYKNHLAYINAYNADITKKLETAIAYHGIDASFICPETIDGKKKPLGVWDFEGEYKYFKTLGAKRYLVCTKDDKLKMTVAGLNKKAATPYLLEKANGDILTAFELFSDNLYIPKGKTGKNVHTYIDDYTSGGVVDYMGEYGTYEEFSSIHMEAADYSLSLSDAYAKFLRGLETKYD